MKTMYGKEVVRSYATTKSKGQRLLTFSLTGLIKFKLKSISFDHFAVLTPLKFSKKASCQKLLISGMVFQAVFCIDKI